MRAIVENFRFFFCARCQVPVVVCTSCDRGQIYCAGACSEARRRESLRSAGAEYQGKFDGRRRHAARQARYRASLRNKVTHQGSVVGQPTAQLAPEKGTPAATTQVTAKRRARRRLSEGGQTCHFCGRPAGAAAGSL